MSWSIKAKGDRQAITDALKADPGAPYMPVGLPILIEDLLSKTIGKIELTTHGHVSPEGIGDVHLTIAQAVPAKEDAARGVRGTRIEEMPARKLGEKEVPVK